MLHVVRYRASEWEKLIDDINANGFGLTMGVHSRIDEHIERVAERARVGNLYVNRNMIGAVVGVQPFGGEGLSGTGPKAGGPLYLPRLGIPPTLQVAPAKEENANALSVFRRRVAQSNMTPSEKEALDHLAVRLQTFGLSHAVLELKGPTGESNRLHFHPRGTIGCIGANVLEATQLAMMAIATGGRALLVAEQIDPALSGAVGILDQQTPLDALLFTRLAQGRIEWQQRLAIREGAITPLILVPAEIEAINIGHLARLLHERSISINTAAAGGNAALMVLEDA
jgi:RHH-type proline utilization regulon transcriptional repressor/proline dehydrogenase/delta 1-pyrroline-5-carboxylate dehydrogenase